MNNRFIYRFTLFTGLIFLAGKVFSQPVFNRNDSIIVFNGTTQLKNPWAGGLNFTEWSAVDLDLDGFKDIVVFDKSGDKLRAFMNDKIPGLTSYTHSPAYQNQLPAVNSWCVFYDYNQDGKQDIFTYSYGNGGIKVFRNTSTPGNLSFTLAKNLLYSNYHSQGPPAQNYNLYCSQVAIPGFADLDGDGDMDILSFSAVGVTIEHHQNMSMELYGIKDSLIFNMIDACWGDIDESSCIANMNSTLNGCPPYQKYKQVIQDQEILSPNLHAGSCIMCYDADGDKDVDLVLGDISCDSLDFMRNGGIYPYAHIDSITKVFPAQQVATFKTFPCSYFLDVDNDNKRDFIVTPNLQGSENYQSVWMYKNINQDTLPKFQFIKNNFFQEDMIDLGEGAYPAAFDYEGDGDLDLLVGNFGYFSSSGSSTSYNSSLALFINTGTPAAPQFVLQSIDFQNLSSYNIVNKAPALGDFDNDGDADLFIGGYDGRLTYFQNTAPIGSPAVFTFVSDYANGFLQSIDIGTAAYPFMVDMDRDGLKDLLVGEYNVGANGGIDYFQNTGTASAPALTFIKANLGAVQVNEPGYSYAQAMPVVFDDGGTYKMAVGSERGYIYMYGNIDGNLSGNFTKIDSIYGGIQEGEHVAPCIADFNNDGVLDLMLGNYSGGLSYFKGSPNNTSIAQHYEMLSGLSVYPNPARDNFTLKFDSYNLEKKQIQVCDAMGQVVKEFSTFDNVTELNTVNMSDGVYIVRVFVRSSASTISAQMVKKIIINK